MSFVARDDFKQKDKDILAARVGYMCSLCGKPTVGPQRGGSGSVKLGDASHIAAASPGGPRYDAAMTAEERSSIDNGIWLCKECAWKIDHDVDYYTTERLNEIKSRAETNQLASMSNRNVLNHDKAILNSLFKTYSDLKSSRLYFFAYYQENFSHISSAYEISEIISRYWENLYSSLYDYVKSHNKCLENLGELLCSHSMEISDELYSNLEAYLNDFSFSYSSDGMVGMYNDYYGKFFMMIAGNNEKQEKREKKIEKSFRQNRNRV